MTGKAHRRLDVGSGTIWVACASMLLGALAFGGGVVAAAVAARHTAEAAADLAALAGASAAARGSADPCGEAESIAAADHADLVSCAVQSPATVTVSVRAKAGWPASRFSPGWAGATSRAGPAHP